jgi:hypothetical protein
MKKHLFLMLIAAAALTFVGCDKKDADDELTPGVNEIENAPPYAASNKVWVIGDQTWSDAIHIPECKDAGFKSIYNIPFCRSCTSGTNTWYYYNWTYVNQNAATLCPSPWRVPTREDFTTLKSHPDVSAIRASWGCGGYVYGPAGLYYLHSQAHYWSSTDYSISRAYYLTFSPLGIYYRTNKYFGRQVRCVK